MFPILTRPPVMPFHPWLDIGAGFYIRFVRNWVQIKSSLFNNEYIAISILVLTCHSVKPFPAGLVIREAPGSGARPAGRPLAKSFNT